MMDSKGDKPRGGGGDKGKTVRCIKIGFSDNN